MNVKVYQQTSNKLKSNKNKLPKISNISYQSQLNSIIETRDQRRDSMLNSTKKMRRVKLVHKTPSDFKSMIERLKRDFSIEEHSPLQNIRIANQNSDIMRMFDNTNKAKFIEKKKNEKYNFQKYKKFNSKISYINASTINNINETAATTTIINNRRDISNAIAMDSTYTKLPMRQMLHTIDDISSNLNLINLNLEKKQNHLYNKHIKFEYDLHEIHYNPSKVSGVPGFLKTKFNKNTINTYKAISGKNFGGVGIRK